MQHISFYEKMLIRNIQDKNTGIATSLITLLNETNSLNYVDEHGKSFLNHALEANNESVAKTLLELQKDNPLIIFGEDHAEKTCLLLAAQQGYVDIVEKIIALAKKVKPNSQGYKIWLKTDKNGDIPLHVAVAQRKIEVVKLLLTILSEENKERAKNLVNRKNNQRNTALHLACIRSTLACDDDIISLLIQHGADLNLTNMDKQTPFHLICERDIEKQSDLLDILLKNEVQEIFLHCYQLYAEQNSDDKTVENNYRKLCEQRNITIYQDAVKEFIGFNLVEGTIDQSIPHFLLPKDNLAEPHKIQSQKNYPLAEYQLLEQDDDTLQKLIADVEAYLADLQTRPSLISYNALAILAMITFTLVFVAIEIWLLIMVDKYGKLGRNYTDPDRDQYDQPRREYFLASLLFGILSLGTLFGLPSSYFLGYCNMSGEIFKKISHDEWAGAIATLRNNIRTTLLEKLQFLEDKEQEDKQIHQEDATDYLHPQAQDIRDLEANLAEFNSENKTVPEMIDIMSRLDEILKRIQSGMLQTNKPFSMFYQADTIIDIGRKVDELNVDEHTPIMRLNTQ